MGSVDAFVVGSNGNDHASDNFLRVAGLEDELVPEMKLLETDHMFGGAVSEVVEAPFLDRIRADFEEQLLGHVVTIAAATSARATFTERLGLIALLPSVVGTMAG